MRTAILVGLYLIAVAVDQNVMDNHGYLKVHPLLVVALFFAFVGDINDLISDLVRRGKQVKP